MPSDVKQYRVFIASPGGLQEERKKFREVVNGYTESDALPRGVLFTPVRWEETLGGIGGPQTFINKEIRECDFFLLLLWDRWRSRPDSSGQHKHSSHTEEEYHLALDCYKDGELPMCQVIAFFKAVDARQMSDPGEELKKVLDFKGNFDRDETIFYETFDHIDAFADRLRRYLAQWLRDHESARPSVVSEPQRPPALRDAPSRLDMGVDVDDPAREIGGKRSEVVEEAMHLAEEGQLTEAETKFAQAVVSADDPVALNRYGHFLQRIGRLAQAEVMHERVIELGASIGNEAWQSVGFGSLGAIYQTRGDLDKAEQMHLKSLEIDEKLRLPEGMASDYGNLGLIYQTRGDLDEAEETFLKSLEIEEKLGAQEGIATAYGNLGLVYQTRGDLDRAEEMHLKSLEINEKLGLQEGMANQYGNIGLVCQTRGDLDKAEEMLLKALEVEKRIGRQEGIATAYGNLSLVYKARGDLGKAEETLLKALEINEKLGCQEGMASDYGTLGTIYGTRGDLDKAEEMLLKALEINEKLGRQEGMATQYANLGLIDRSRGSTALARVHWCKALGLFRKIGVRDKSEDIERLLNELPPE
ncbi:MAG: tetratricopeptide repeat protein [Armatimonadetes bacterium]|nr:tetratricopeptide repeat protein [Armatimonadota bacterium]